MIPLGCGLGRGHSSARRDGSAGYDAWAWVFLRACLATSLGLDEAAEVVAVLQEAALAEGSS